MPNVTIGEYATIGAGSIVTKDIPAFSLAAGSPAKVLRTGGNEYIKKYTEEQKFELMIEIMSEYADFLRYTYSHNIEIITESDFAKIKANNFSIYLVTNISIMAKLLIKPSDVVISMKCIPEESTNNFNSKNISWFDIESKRTYFNNNYPWKTTKDFLSRYGIRFYTLPD